MLWILVILVALCLVGVFVTYTRIIQPLRLLRDSARGIADSRPVSGIGTLMLGYPRLFAEFAADLECVSARQLQLARQIHEDGFHQSAILSSMMEGVVVLDENRHIRLVNEPFINLFQLKTAPVGQTLLSALRLSEIDDVTRVALSTGEPQSRESMSQHGSRSGSTVHFIVNAMPIKDADGNQRGAVLVFHDTSRLRQLESIRTEFVANVSHELRTPLSILSGYLENLLDNPTMPRKQQAATFVVMERHAKRLKALLEDLLILARLESRGEKLDFDELNIQPFLAQLTAEWENQLSKKQQTLTLDIAADMPVLWADEFRLRQVLDNLLDNAAKYTPEKTAISISTRAANEQAVITVRDNGAGIPAADLPHIFERFYRVDKARSREKGGTGLGLSIVKHIIHAHGGSVTAASEYGKGTAVTLTLPLRQPIEPPPQLETSAAHPAAAPLPGSAPPRVDVRRPVVNAD